MSVSLENTQTKESEGRLKSMRGNCGDWLKINPNEDAILRGEDIIVKDNDDNQYILEKCLGQGFEGEVWKVRDKLSGHVYALKFEVGDVDIGKQLKTEYEILSSLDNPLILKAYKYWGGDVYGPTCNTDDYCSDRGHMLTEYIDGHSLSDYIGSKKLSNMELTRKQSRDIILDLLNAIKY